MKRKIIKSSLILLICVMFFSLNSKISANTIKKVDMNVYIDKNGNASITEIWNADLSEGTEGYRKFSKLGKKIISNFVVIDDLGKEYSNIGSWNSNTNFSAKSYKCGIIEKQNELEFCWGISKYGNRKYVLKYNIENLVTQYNDCQGIYFNFFNIEQTVDNVKITINSDYYFSEQSEKVWNFGNKGNYYFDNGSIVINSNGKVYIDDYFSTLIKFEKDYFKLYDYSNKKFENVLKEALKDNNSHDVIWTIVGVLLVIFFISPWIIYLLKPYIEQFFYKVKRRRYLIKTKEVLPSNSKIEIYTKIPCEGDIFKIYYLIHYYKIPIKGNIDIIGSLLLKWKIDKKIEFFYDDANNYCINFNKTDSLNNTFEKSLYKAFVKISGENKILNVNKLKKLSRKDFYQIYNWEISLYSSIQKQLFEQGLVDKIKKEYRNLEILREEAIRLKGFVKYLNRIKRYDNEWINGDSIEKYIIYAYLLGEYTKTYKKLNKISKNSKLFKSENIDVDSIAAQRATKWLLRKIWNNIEKTSNYHRNMTSISDSDGGNYSGGGSSAGGSSGGGFR